MRTSDDYSAAVCIYPSGQTRKTNCVTERLDTVDAALAKLRKDNAAWVHWKDEEATVRQWRQELDARRITQS